MKNQKLSYYEKFDFRPSLGSMRATLYSRIDSAIGWFEGFLIIS